ncbi:MAG: hypothetical protein WA988_07020 [Candidatus Nanopelagicales bacterium]
MGPVVNSENLTNTEQAINAVGYLVVIVIFIFYGRQVRVQRAHAREMGLPKTQRMRTVAQQWLDPVIIILIAGVLLYQDLIGGTSHIISAACGLVIGLGFGWARGRLEYVRYVPEHNAMILKITAIEVVMIIGLVLLKVLLDSAGAEPNGIIMLLISAAIFLDIGDSIGKSAHLTRRFRQDEAAYGAQVLGEGRGEFGSQLPSADTSPPT